LESQVSAAMLKIALFPCSIMKVASLVHY